MKGPISWQTWSHVTRSEMAQLKASTAQQKKERRFTRHCSTQLPSTVLSKSGEELEPKPKEMFAFVNKQLEAKKHRTELCAANNQIPLREMQREQSEDMQMPGKCGGAEQNEKQR